MKKLITSFAIMMVVLLFGCRKEDYVAKSPKCPVVVSTNPTNGALNVPVNQVVTATFNEYMNPKTINDSSFTLKQGSTSIPGILTYNANNYTLSFVPTVMLLENTTYTGIIAYTVKDSFGDAMLNDYVWSFSTGITLSPLIIATDPANGSTAIVINKTISATFNMPMDPLTINGTTFSVSEGIHKKSTPVAGTVSYTGLTASFTASANLLPGTIYTATITNGVKSVDGLPMQNTYIWTFTTGTLVAPVVISTDPLNLSNGIAVNKIIGATFSVPMDPSTMSATTFNVRLGTNAVSGTVSYSGSTAFFTPSGNLAAGTIYTATITTGAKNVSGTPLANNYVWTFTTIGVLPIVISTDPASNETGVVLNKTATATFNVAMDPLTLNSTTFTIKQGSTPITGVISYTGNTVSFNPGSDFLPAAQYTATITTGTKNAIGNAMANNYVWTFTTGVLTAPKVIATDPTNLATGVALNKTISATFNMPMDPLTISTSTFSLKQGTNVISGTVSYNGTIATFVPTTNLVSGLIYTATITTGAKNLVGTPLASNYQWSFTTISATAPTVISTDPLNKATSVALNKKVSASFSVSMDPTTISNFTFTLQLGTSAVAGSVSYSGTTAVFTPTVNLLSDNTYTSTITTGAKNTSGTPMASNYVWTFTTVSHSGPIGPNLQSVARFGIVSGTGISNNAGFSVINNMDVGIYPGFRSSVTGFPPAKIVNGAIYAADDLIPTGTAAMLKQAKKDLTDAYLYAKGASSPAPSTVSGDQGGKTLAPGIYTSTSTLLIQNGDLTLDAKGDANAVWIFQIASAFTTIGSAGGNVILTGGAQAKNIFWQTGSSATIGGYTAFYGNIMALTSITMGGYAVATGRMLAINGAVVMTSTDIINKP